MNAAVLYWLGALVKHRLVRSAAPTPVASGSASPPAAERGATAVEYTLLVTFVALVIIVAVSQVGDVVIDLIQPVVDAL